MSKPAAVPARRILSTRTTSLKVMLTEPEKKAAAETLARVEGERREHLAKKKEITSDLKSKEDRLDADLAVWGRIVRDGYEYRPVPCRMEADFKAGMVYEIREDTGEVIGERPANAQDRQTSILDALPAEKAADAERAEVERQADAILANAGDGKLIAKDLSGPPEARKRGGRRP